MSDFVQLMGFGPLGWGASMLRGAGITLAIALGGFLMGSVIGALGAWAKINGGVVLSAIAGGYTTILRGIPDLLVIYLFYFGAGSILTPLAHLFGSSGFISLPGFLAGVIAIGITSGAYQTEVFRGGCRAVFPGEIEAATACGMSRWLKFRRIVAPLTLRYSLPALGNVWQQVLKETALVSVTGAVELVRQAQVGAGSTHQPFPFYFGAAILYLIITLTSSGLMQRAERWLNRGLRTA
jgi:octopine/nopaline transport system permease protein